MVFGSPSCVGYQQWQKCRAFLLLGEGLRGLYHYLLSLRGEEIRKKPPSLGTVPNQSSLLPHRQPGMDPYGQMDAKHVLGLWVPG